LATFVAFLYIAAVAEEYKYYIAIAAIVVDPYLLRVRCGLLL